MLLSILSLCARESTWCVILRTDIPGCCGQEIIPSPQPLARRRDLLRRASSSCNDNANGTTLFQANGKLAAATVGASLERRAVLLLQLPHQPLLEQQYHCAASVHVPDQLDRQARQRHTTAQSTGLAMPTSASQCHLSRWVPVQSSSTWRPMCFAPLATSSTNPSGLQPTLQPTILCTLCQSSTVHHRTTSSRNSPLNGREAASSSSSTRLGNRAICPTEHRSCAALLGTPVEWFCTILVLHGTHYDMLARTVVTPHGVSTACASPSVLPTQLGAQSQAGNSSEMRPASSRLAHLLRDAPFHAGVCGHGMMLVTEPHDLIVCGAEEESALFCQCCWHLLFLFTFPLRHRPCTGINMARITATSV